MLNRKVLEILKRLDVNERKQLRLFLASPYFVHGMNSEKILRLYDLIIQYDAEESRPGLDKKKLSRLFFPNSVYRENEKGPLDKIASDLFRLIRRFLAQSTFDEATGDAAEFLNLAKFYRKHGMEERIEAALQSARKLNASVSKQDAESVFNQFRLEEEDVLFRSTFGSGENDLNLIAAQNQLDVFYCIKTLEAACLLEYQRRKTQIDAPSAEVLLEPITHLLKSANVAEAPLVKIFGFVLQLLRNDYDEDQLHTLEQLLGRYEPMITDEVFKSLMAYNRLFWVMKYQKSVDINLRQKVFGMHKAHLEKGYFYIDGKIPMTSFRNLIMFGLKMEQYDWVNQFFEAHQPDRISGTRFPAEVYSINFAEYQFYLGHYEKAQDMLVYRLFEHPGMSVTADLLLIKIYYKTQSELIFSRIKALDQKIRRSTQSKEVKERYLNFLRKLDKILKYGWQKRSVKRNRLIEEIKSTKAIAQREWLLEILTKK